MYATPTTTGLEVAMHNQRIEKLIFPASQGAVSYGNRLLDTAEQANKMYVGWLYQYVNVLQPYNHGRLIFENTVTVNEINDSVGNPEANPGAYADRHYAREIYGYDVGMIYREFTHWSYDPSDPAMACRKGFSVVMRATDHN